MEEITKEEILAAIVSRFFDDYEFIETINNITYQRKAQLRAKHTQHGKPTT
ncbi:MAG: hypothetical protein AAB787_01660 [Patescibacteria group bacterium]|mgnify:CR=1 FL=1